MYFCLSVNLGSDIRADKVFMHTFVFLNVHTNYMIHLFHCVVLCEHLVFHIHCEASLSHHPYAMKGIEFLMAWVALVTISAICVCCMNLW